MSRSRVVRTDTPAAEPESGPSASTEPRTAPWRLPHSAAFPAMAAIFVVFMAASSAPSPLYVVYQHQWHFSAGVLTVVFAVYVAGLIASLLVLGALSDHIGRRPVLAIAIILEALALVLFLIAGNVSVLLLARLVQGIGTGAAMTTLGAALVDLDPPHARGRAGVVNTTAPTAGIAIGALGCGALVQFAPAPTHFIYALLLGGIVLALVVVALAPETSPRRPGAAASLAPRLGVPQRLRADLLMLVPIMLAAWALGGLYLSLGPSVAVALFGISNHLVGGTVVTLMCGTGAVSAFAVRGVAARRLLAPSALLLAAGTAVALTGVLNHSALAGALGTAVAGVGFGTSLLAAFGTLARIAAPTERGELFAVVYLISYLAFSLPAVVAGFVANNAGLRPTTTVYALAVIALAVLALVAPHLRRPAHA